MNLITWNVAGRIKKFPNQIEMIKKNHPDIITLQEITKNNLPLFLEQLPLIGFKYITNSFQFFKEKADLKGPRRYGLLIASKWPLVNSHIGDHNIIWPERFLTATVNTPNKDIMIHTTHIPPGSSNGWKKVEMLEGIYKYLSQFNSEHRIITGDFNLPQEEDIEGNVYTWAYTKNKKGEYRISASRGEKWDAAERNIITGLKKYELIDVYRHLYGYKVQEFSWYLKRKDKMIGRRFDHVFASNSLNPIQAEYIQDVREEKISDHSMLQVLFKE
jgi:exonuclease III